MKLYRVAVNITGTAYIRATSRNAARTICDTQLRDVALIVAHGDESEIEISGLHFNDPNLPDLSLSPAMTVHGMCGTLSIAE